MKDEGRTPPGRRKSPAVIICWRCRTPLPPQQPRCPRCNPDPPPMPEGEWVERYRDGAVDE